MVAVTADSEQSLLRGWMGSWGPWPVPRGRDLEREREREGEREAELEGEGEREEDCWSRSIGWMASSGTRG